MHKPGWPVQPELGMVRSTNPLHRIKRQRPPSVRRTSWKFATTTGIAHFGRRTPDKVAVVDLASERHLSYAQFDARISRLATHLRDRLGIISGDRVAVLALNTTDTLE